MISMRTVLNVRFTAALASTSGLHDREAIAEEAETGEHLNNEVALVIGVTHERRENGGALGLEYGRRVNDRFGVGIFAERTWGEFVFRVVGVPLVFHADRWKFIAAPGIEDSDQGTEELLRLGVGYEIETESTLIKPLLGVDFVGGEQVYVLGASFGLEF